MSSKDQQQKAAEKLRGSVLAYRDPVEPIVDWTEWSAWGDGKQSMEELRNSAWQQVLELFESDEASAQDWMTRARAFLGNATPDELLDCPENIVATAMLYPAGPARHSALMVSRGYNARQTRRSLASLSYKK